MVHVLTQDGHPCWEPRVRVFSRDENPFETVLSPTGEVGHKAYQKNWTRSPPYPWPFPAPAISMLWAQIVPVLNMYGSSSDPGWSLYWRCMVHVLTPNDPCTEHVRFMFWPRMVTNVESPGSGCFLEMKIPLKPFYLPLGRLGIRRIRKIGHILLPTHGHFPPPPYPCCEPG